MIISYRHSTERISQYDNALKVSPSFVLHLLRKIKLAKVTIRLKKEYYINIRAIVTNYSNLKVKTNSTRVIHARI